MRKEREYSSCKMICFVTQKQNFRSGCFKILLPYVNKKTRGCEEVRLT
jgi:hypothetical protein